MSQEAIPPAVTLDVYAVLLERARDCSRRCGERLRALTEQFPAGAVPAPRGEAAGPAQAAGHVSIPAVSSATVSRKSANCRHSRRTATPSGDGDAA